MAVRQPAERTPTGSRFRFGHLSGVMTGFYVML
jgi:hypothetical protein